MQQVPCLTYSIQYTVYSICLSSLPVVPTHRMQVSLWSTTQGHNTNCALSTQPPLTGLAVEQAVCYFMFMLQVDCCINIIFWPFLSSVGFVKTKLKLTMIAFSPGITGKLVSTRGLMLCISVYRYRLVKYPPTCS